MKFQDVRIETFDVMFIVIIRVGITGLAVRVGITLDSRSLKEKLTGGSGAGHVE